MSARSRSIIHKLATTVRPYGDQETADQNHILNWIDSGAPLFRVTKPATPEPHLCVYFALLDDATRSILLIDHVKSGLWLPPGGHVDLNEDPRVTVRREAHEELGLHVDFHPQFGNDPLFLTVTKTRGEHSHTDITLWFVLAGNHATDIVLDKEEANAARWFALDNPRDWTINQPIQIWPAFGIKSLQA